MNRNPIPKQSKKRLAAIAAGTYKPKAKKALKRTPLKKKRKNTGQAKVFREIWDSRAHVCEVCSYFIHVPRAHNFSHILPKGTYPDLMLIHDNISIQCWDCHNRWHQYGAEGLRYSHGWQGIVGRYDELKRRAYTP